MNFKPLALFSRSFLRDSCSAIAVALTLFLAVLRANATIDVTLQMQLGNPSGAITDTNNHSHYLIQRTVEALDYNDALGEPNWASWDLTADDLGTSGRADNFHTDTNLPPNFHRVIPDDYTDSGYDRGHLCPSADRTDTTNDNDLVFFMSNIMPQAPDNNEGVWKNFENFCRGLVQPPTSDELLILCGPSGFDGSHINTNGYVAVPQYTWKIAVVVGPGGGTAVSRITATNRVIAIKVPNTNGVSSTWQDFVTSANQIQVDTGYTFFTALPSDVASALRSKVDGQTNPPPVIFSFSPTSGSTIASVVITGTNFSLTSAVTFNGASAAFTVDADTQITATVPTNAGSGFISVTTPSGTAISSNSFTVLNNGGTVYIGLLAGWDMSGLPGGLNNYGPSPMPPTTNAANLIIGGLTRGSGVKLTGTGGGGGWGGDGFVSVTPTNAVTSNQFATFTIAATNGYKVSLGSLSRFDYRRSGTGPTNGLLQYQVGSGAFADITNIAYSSAANGATNAPIDLSTFAALQNVGAGTNITLRIVNYGAGSSSGTWYVFDVVGSTALDLAVQGTITQVISLPALAPTLSLPVFTNNQFQFTLIGTAGSNYIIQATTDIGTSSWISLKTNTAPFVFTETNALSQRFYRGMIAP